MPAPLILASGSRVRAEMLTNVRLDFTVQVPRIDEVAVRDGLLSEGATPRDIADALADMKARKISQRFPDAIVVGCDQVLDFDRQIFAKPHTEAEALSQLRRLSGKTHRLLSAVVVYQDARPLWRHVGQVRLTMHDHSDVWLGTYVARNWPDLADAVGAYKLESEGARLFSRIDGDYFTVLGLPLLDLLSYLRQRETVDT